MIPTPSTLDLLPTQFEPLEPIYTYIYIYISLPMRSALPSSQRETPIDSIDLSTTGNPQFEDPNSHPRVLFDLLSMCSLLWPWTFWSWCLTWCFTSLRMSTGFCWGEVIHPFILGNGWVGNPINPGPMAKFLFCHQKNPHGRKLELLKFFNKKNTAKTQTELKRDLPCFFGEVNFLTEWFCSFLSF